MQILPKGSGAAYNTLTICNMKHISLVPTKSHTGYKKGAVGSAVKKILSMFSPYFLNRVSRNWAKFN